MRLQEYSKLHCEGILTFKGLAFNNIKSQYVDLIP